MGTFQIFPFAEDFPPSMVMEEIVGGGMENRNDSTTASGEKPGQIEADQKEKSAERPQYTNLAKQIGEEATRVSGYFFDKPEKAKDIESIYRPVTSSLRTIGVVSRRLTEKEPELADAVLRLVEEAIGNLQSCHGIEKLDALYQAKKELSPWVKKLKETPSPCQQHGFG